VIDAAPDARLNVVWLLLLKVPLAVNELESTEPHEAFVGTCARNVTDAVAFGPRLAVGEKLAEVVLTVQFPATVEEHDPTPIKPDEERLSCIVSGEMEYVVSLLCTERVMPTQPPGGTIVLEPYPVVGTVPHDDAAATVFVRVGIVCAKAF
jgi:hypothetical protein